VVADRSAEYEALLQAAPAGCPTTRLDVTLDGAIAAGSWPLVVYSHCHECLGVSGASVARRLATWGYIVIAPDHVDNTLWDQVDGTNVDLGSAFLEVRGQDVIGLIDAALAGAAPFADLTPNIDSGAIAVVGHSFGAVTAGYVAERDPRIVAMAALAAPVENPLIAGVTAANIMVPTMMLVAVEDNSITEFGNTMIRTNYEALGGPATKVEVADAGHWSVSDVCGVAEMFMPGCGEDNRQTDGSAFTYLPADRGREIAAAWVTAHFESTVRESDEALVWIDGNQDPEIDLSVRNSD
jgi:dienelactone hydrolase